MSDSESESERREKGERFKISLFGDISMALFTAGMMQCKKGAFLNQKKKRKLFFVFIFMSLITLLMPVLLLVTSASLVGASS